jgi:diguanylate cyclase
MGLIDTLREKRTIHQLSDELARARSRSVLLQDATAACLGSIKALVLDIDEIGAPALKAALDETLGRLRAEAPVRELADDLADRHRETLAFAGKERQYLGARDAELLHIISLLKDGLSIVGAGNAAHDRRILQQGSRLEAAAQLGDIARIRQVITREVADLRKAVEDKQSADAAHTAALTREVETLRKDVARAQAAAATDPLTTAANRGAFDGELERLSALAAVGGETFSLLMLDLDHFKAINDTHGHPVGDRVLMALVGFCREHVRRGDMVARYGGEEFAVLLPSASLRVAYAKARVMVKELAARRWGAEGGATLRVTVSIGVAAWQRDDTPTTVLERADRSLYEAKHRGRNRAVKAA